MSSISSNKRSYEETSAVLAGSKKAKAFEMNAAEAAAADGVEVCAYESKMKALAESVAAATLPVLPDEKELNSHIEQWKERSRRDDDFWDRRRDGGDGERKNTGQAVGVYIGNDKLIPSELRDSLHAQFNVIANNPNKDFHPGSRDQVLNLIHPSMYPFVAGRSQPVTEKARKFVEKKLARLSTKARVKAGIASDEEIAKMNKPKKSKADDDVDDADDDDDGDDDESNHSSNDENLHVSYLTAHSEVLGRKYEDSMYQWMPAEFGIDAKGHVTIESDINSLSRTQFPLLYRDIAAVFERMAPMVERCINFGTPRPYFQKKPKEWQIRGSKLQVIVKAATYILRPGETEYSGSWHVEGMSHERIIASGIYYYHTSPHLKGEGLMFRRRQTDEEVEEDADGDPEASAVRDMGTVPTPSGNCLVFHNQYQHCVDTLTNPSEDEIAERKILCFFVVDPNHKVISTAHIGDQRVIRSDVMDTIHQHLPKDVSSLVCDYATVGMSHSEALEVRRQLMIERKFFVDHHNEIWEREYSLCEH